MTDPYVTLAITYLAQILNCHTDDLSQTDTITSVKKWDSLNHMRLVLHIEEELGHQIETDDAMALFSIEDIANFLRKNDKS